MTPAKGLLVALVAILAVAGASARSVPGPASAPAPGRVPDPFGVSAGHLSATIYFHDADHAGYPVVCRAANVCDAGIVVSFVDKNDNGARPDSDVVAYVIHVGAPGNYTCDFSRTAGAPATSVEFTVPVPVPEPFFVGASYPSATISFHDADHASYPVVCRAENGSEVETGMTFSDKFDSGSRPDSDVVTYVINFDAPGNYTCDFSRTRDAPATSVEIAVYPENTVPDAPVPVDILARAPETTVVFPVLARAAKYFASCRSVDSGRCVATSIANGAPIRGADDIDTRGPAPTPGSYGGAPWISTMEATFDTEPGKYECVIFAKDSSGRTGGKALVTFDVIEWSV